MINGYPKIWNLGHPNVSELFSGTVVVQEKVDGSQISFGTINGELFIRSKGAQIHPPTTDKLFRKAVEYIVGLYDAKWLIDGYVYRGEAMCGPKHNTLVYDTAPEAGLVLFDIDMGYENRLDIRPLLERTAQNLGLMVVPQFYMGTIENVDQLKGLLDYPSFLGGKIEGIVIKNYKRFGLDGKMLMGKLVREDFKESHHKEWGKVNPGKGDIIERITDGYRVDKRWEKAIQHLRENGTLTESPKDIGPLIKEISDDVATECKAEIMEALYNEFWPQIRRGLTRGFPEWYKDRLTNAQTFGDN